MADVLNVEAREERGSQKARKMRRDGKVPAILYGHGADNVSLAVLADELNTALRQGAKTLDLKGAVSETAFIKDVQWDAFGNEVLHVDLTRVKKGEKVEVELSVELRGTAPGTKVGGVVDQLQRSVKILCPMSKIPDNIQLSINELELGQQLTVADLEIPDGAELVTDAGIPVVNCQEPKAGSDEVETAAPADGAEPEVIGQKDDADAKDE